MLWKAMFKRQTPLTDEDTEKVMATDGPTAGLLPGAFPQQKVQSAGTGEAGLPVPSWTRKLLFVACGWPCMDALRGIPL